MLTRCLMAGLVVSIALGAAGWAAKKKPVYIDAQAAAEADEDFKIQGEYLGRRQAKPGEPDRLGAQVVALGEGQFQLNLFKGGLPGEGYEKRTTAKNMVAKGQRRDDGRVVFDLNDDGKVVIDDGRMNTYGPNGKILWTLQRIERKSPTLGKEAPQGAVVLFDGTKGTMAHWEKGKMSDDGLLMQGAISKDRFGDCTIHVEFLLPYKPHARGQGRGNSGLYVAGRYEVQMLDSFGLEGKGNECGGIYSVAAPRINMCLPPLQWQTYDIEYTAPKFDEAGEKTAAARMTVKHNGVVIHDDVACANPTAAFPKQFRDESKPGPLYLQDHGNPVRYRNIWVLPKH